MKPTLCLSLCLLAALGGCSNLGQVNAWEKGDLAALESYESWCECVADEADRAMMRKLNDERNAPLADGIEARHQQGRRVFAAVGALHMTGPQSLPKLLEQRGFKVERVIFKP